jgi:HemY protein
MKLFRSFLVLLLVAAIGILGAQWLGQDSLRDLGEVTVHAGGYDYIATVPQALIALLITLLLFWALWSLLTAPFQAWKRHRRRQGRARLIDGLEALDRGQWLRAEKLLTSASAEERVRTISHVGALKAAEARGDTSSAAQHLSALAQTDPVLHALHSAERWLELDRAEEAITALDLAAIQPLPARGLWLRTSALASAGRAAEAFGQLGALRQHQVLTADAAAALELQLATQMLGQAQDVNVLAGHWEALPKTLRLDPPVVAAYVEQAVALGWADTALRTLEQTLDSQWSEDLVRLYGHLPVEKYDSRRASAQRWLQDHGNSPALLLSLARLTHAQGQFDQALEFAQRAIPLGAGAEGWELAGEIFIARGEQALACQCLLNALRERRGDAVADLPGHELQQDITRLAAVEERDAHGIPHLPGQAR